MVSLDFDGDVIVETIGASKDAVRNWMHPCQLDAGRLKPRPIKVGDRVTWGSGDIDYELILVRGDDACLTDGRVRGSRALYHTGLVVFPVSQLVKV